MSKARFATAWLDGCSGCHMSFLDLDERLLELGELIELVYSPLVDTKEIPEGIDVCLVEGAVSSEEDLHKIKVLRDRTRVLIACGDCAVTTNVPGMRNLCGTQAALTRSYVENATVNHGLPAQIYSPGSRARDGDGDGDRQPESGIPPLLPTVVPVHHVVAVDHFLPGCPPPADAIWQLLREVLDPETPRAPRLSRFGT